MVCNVEGISDDNVCKSSSKYELTFAVELSKFVDRVSVVSPKIIEDYQIENLKFFCCPNCDLMYKVKPIRTFLKKIINRDDDTVVLFWGYNPILINNLCKLKSDKTKVVSMVYDTHLGDTTNKTILKRYIIDIFYRLGIMQINRLDSVLLFKEKAKQYLKLKKKYCVILPSVNIDDIEHYFDTNNDVFTFLYSGTLCEYNGTRELIDAFNSLDLKDVRLEIYGDGPLTQEVEHATATNPKIFYGGRISNKELSLKMHKADVLLNLRQVDSVVNDFAFPSKIVEYMSSGRMIISSKITDCPEFEKSVYLLENLDSSAIADKMRYVCDRKAEFKEKHNDIVAYLKKYHDHNSISHKAYSFLFDA